MLKECEQQLLDELTFEERSVFLYFFLLKMPQKEIARHLSLSVKFVNTTTKLLKREIDFLPIRDELLESFALSESCNVL